MDASGSLSSNLVDRILQRGYTVHAVVQNHGDLQLQAFKGISSDNSKNLKAFHANPFDYQSIMDALKGCSGLSYSFEPLQYQPTFDSAMATSQASSFTTTFPPLTATGSSYSSPES
uniref:Uncharacterized protein n=1 Tax=Nelumbo nucifera TaxID=4432 RepID=A0A822ZCN5_NELNU|nr:TPA_asm: hypothetical protein HUJ06_000533 [Nelumbo nucifera]